MKIKEFETDSLAQEAGIRIGDDILNINGHSIRDIIDYRFYSSDEELEIEINRDDEIQIFEIEKDFDDNLGIIFQDIKYRLCGNKCIFCFIDQNPDGMRESIYVKDEDFRLSFIYGNYVTLTNISRKNLDRIVEQKLSPLYISVHSTDLEIRKHLLGIKNDDRLMDKIKFLIENHIEIHAQIVLCPGINDGESLLKTIQDLSTFYPYLKSVAIVPIGLTKHRKNLYPLESVTADFARRLIPQVDEIAQNYKNQNNDFFIYLADEFYILAGMDLPQEERYEEFHQVENGVGMTRYFINTFKEQNQQLPHRITHKRRLTIVTGKLAGNIIDEIIVKRLNRIKNLEVNSIIIKNNFFGESVTVTGLLTGEDIYTQLKQIEYGDYVILPANCLNFEGKFLDNWTPEMLETKLNSKVEIVDSDFISLIESIS